MSITTIETSTEYSTTFTGMLVAPDGVERYFINGAYGREGDLPSIVHPDGSQFWFKENPKRGGFGQTPAVQHRDGGLPAAIKANGDQLFYVEGKLHRDDELPAVMLADGTLKWFVKGECVRYAIPSNQE
jgi:hypothetical protein